MAAISLLGTVPGMTGIAFAGVLAAGVLAAGALALAAQTRRLSRDAERRVPPDGLFIALPRARLHYRDIGSGPPVVLVHGLGGQMRNFTYALAERLAPHHRLLIIDRPDAGYSTWTGSTDHSLAAHADVVADFIAALELDRPLLVGHSLGGAIGLAVGIAHPDSVSGLALLAPLTQPDSPVSAVHKGLFIRPVWLRKLIAHTLAAPLARRNRAAIGQAVFAPETAPEDFDERGGGALTARPGAFFAASSEVIALNAELTAMRGRYGALRLPVGILYGREDQILPASLHGEEAALQIPDCELTLIAGGHMIPVTAPDTVADWIRRQAGRRLTAGENAS